MTTDAATGPSDRARALVLLERYGWNATSFQILEPGFAYWFDGDDACVGYVDTGHAWVAAGAPIAAQDRIADVAARFADAAAERDRRVCCFATEARFRELTGWTAMRVGDQPVWSPTEWTKSRSLREQLRRATAKGVSVRALEVAELALAHPIRIQLDALIARWLASRPMAPMGFLVQVDPFTFPEHRRYFVAERDGAIVAFLGVIPIFARGGWFFEDLIRDPAAPNGTVELLVDAGMRAAAAERVELVTLGMVPLAGDVGPWLRAARTFGRMLYDFDGLRAFKAKFCPIAWDPIYLACPPERSRLWAIVDTLTAFAHGDLARFGIATLARNRGFQLALATALIVVAVAAMLV